jgi:hypothetical protein
VWGHGTFASMCLSGNVQFAVKRAQKPDIPGTAGDRGHAPGGFRMCRAIGQAWYKLQMLYTDWKIAEERYLR